MNRCVILNHVGMVLEYYVITLSCDRVVAPADFCSSDYLLQMARFGGI